MDLEEICSLSDQDFEAIYFPQKRVPNFEIKYDYRGYFPKEGFFSPKKKQMRMDKNRRAWLLRRTMQ